ncbi:ATP-binding protein [Photobacterium carnosum]|uniref:ATP-binding protein n=1 Tax=Photobacterium carnosum TaxID=2023717 RepID=UPI00128D7568|nr:ATP-binding protein [Photobacterium carnosum]KAE8178245.1 hypothetical protein CIT27_00235 [Photobacterium carnosum]
MYELKQEEKLNTALFEMNDVVFKGYLDNINGYPLVTSFEGLDQTIYNIRIRKIARIVYDRSENTLAKLNSVFSAIHSSQSSLSLILKSDGKHTDIYLGTTKTQSNGHDAMETLVAAIKGNFPGIDIENNLDVNDIALLLEPIKGMDHQAISSVAGVPSLKDNDMSTFSQGLEKIIEGMQGRKYTAIIHANPIHPNELVNIEGAYQDIYTALSVFEQSQITLSENDSQTLGKTVTEGVTNTLSKTIGRTQTDTQGCSESFSHSDSESQSSFDVKRALSQAASGAIGGGVAAGAVSGGLGTGAGALVGAIGGFGMGMFGGSKTESNTTSNTTNASYSFGTSNSETKSESFNQSLADSDSRTSGTGKSLQLTEKNRRVTALLSSIDEQIDRLKTCKNYGMWQWGAYFLGKNELDVKLGADLYSGILRGESTGLERNHIALWKRYENESDFQNIQNYLCQLQHPLFKIPSSFNTHNVTHTSLISTQEMTVAMNLPQKSLPGIPVLDAVPFGRTVTSYRPEQTEQCFAVGHISNFGVIDQNNSVNLDVNSLTGHMFVTGSTGAGKSNTIYGFLSKLYKEKKIPFLVIEPAKGEYKDVFGGMPNVSVFGTNPKLTPLLKINPFSFPNEIHVMEHIDRLIEILNAVWPMYAAMPAILKQAIEETYESLGWDLLNSECAYSPAIFPDFYDLLVTLPKVIEQSDYSQEIKGNYAGALITRVQSLTNGYFKTIFQKEELGSEVLFDQPCIIDLSRVGSSETKSLLMGIIFLKLQSYRMSKTYLSNSKLQYVTVLEEAHNLLRRTSDTQSADSSNVQGKSVEMIANAIAEMRTYGEGFIIADQAPGLLDASVIRNTNTKVILRLPDYSDRNLVGKAAHLNEEQIEYLARLQTGCAAVYQNDWLEPVLCQFDIFDESTEKSFHYDHPEKIIDTRKQSRSQLLKQLVTIVLRNDDEVFNEAIVIPATTYFPEMRICSKSDLHNTIGHILDFRALTKKIKAIESPQLWVLSLFNEIKANIDINSVTSIECRQLLDVALELSLLEKPENKKIIEITVEMMEKRGALL